MKKRTVGQACFINLRKAFDTIDYSILLKNSSAYGYRGPSFEISSDYFKNRFQQMDTDSHKYGKVQTNTNVPLGLILGPFLFLVYIKYWPRFSENNSKNSIFADHVSIVKAGP